MTKKELKQEAEEWLCNNLHSASEEDFIKAMVDIAEPREKRIEELERNVAYYAERAKHAELDGRDIVLKNKDLEKENAKLKNKLEHRNCLDCSNHSSKLRMKTLELEKECTKAKEIIRDLINLTEPTSTEEVQHWNETFRKAEQFLKE